MGDPGAQATSSEPTRAGCSTMASNGFQRTSALLRTLRSANVTSAPVTLAPSGTRSVSLQIVAQRMKSVGNIQKITAAMKMLAASRLKGAQTKMEKSRGMVQPMVRMLGDQPGIEAEKTMIVPVSSDKGLCGGINTTVVKYSKVVSGLSDGSTMSIVGEKARAQLAKGEAEHVQNVIVDLSNIPLTFATASLVTDTILAGGAEAPDRVQPVSERHLVQAHGGGGFLLGRVRESRRGGLDQVRRVRDGGPRALGVPAGPRGVQHGRGDVQRAPGKQHVRARVADAVDGELHEKRQGHAREAHAALQPHAPGVHHHGAHRDHLRRVRARGLRSKPVREER